MSSMLPLRVPSPADVAAVDGELLGFASDLVRTGSMPPTGVCDSPFAYEFCGVCAGTSSFSTFPSPAAAVRAAVVMCAGGYSGPATMLVSAVGATQLASYVLAATDPAALAAAALSVTELADLLAADVAVPGRSVLQALCAARKSDAVYAENTSVFQREEPTDRLVDVVELVALKARFAGRAGAWGVLEVLVRDADLITSGRLAAFVQAADGF